MNSKLLSKISKAGVHPRSPEERGTLLSGFGFTLYTYYELQNIHDMMMDENLNVYPYNLRVTYCDPQLEVGRVEITYKGLDSLVLNWWVDLETVREAGLSPLMLPNGDVVDMAWMCAEQAQSMYNAMFNTPVKDGDAHLWPELSYHIKYLFDTLYHTKHKVKLTNKTEEHFINSIAQAESWRDHFIKLGNIKYRKLMDTERYQAWCDTLVWIEANTKELQKMKEDKKKKQLKKTAKKLASKL